jgi:uncharacterized protein
VKNNMLFLQPKKYNIRLSFKPAKLINLLMFWAVILLIQSCSQKVLVVPAVTDTPTAQYFPGKFVWHDLMTNNVPAVKQFYGELFGWKFVGDEDPKTKYTTITFNGHPIGGIVYVEELDDGSNPSQWMSYLSVQNVDSAVHFFRNNNGTILREAWDQPDRGRMAIVQDAQGALLALLRSDTGDPVDKEPVNFSWLWHEYLTTDAAVALDLYKDFIGYESESIPVRDNYFYYVLSMSGKSRAGMSQVPWEGVKPNWLVYILVEEVQPVVDKVLSLGGEVLLAPSAELRKGSVALVSDPSGGVFAVQKWPYE